MARREPGMARRAMAAMAAALLAVAAAGAAEAPSVARPQLETSAPGPPGASGTVFFLRLPSGGSAAVGAAHNFDLDALGREGAVTFRLGHTGTPIATSTRFLIPPGRPFQSLGGSLAEDVVVFALEAPPRAVRVLEAIGPEGVRVGDRVRLLGVPSSQQSDQDDAFGRVSAVTGTRLELDLDVPADLRGWGGAPVLAEPTGRVMGIVEAFLPDPDRMRVGAAPIAALLPELERPLRSGAGEPFAAFAGPGGERARADAAAAAAPAPDPPAAGASKPAAAASTPPPGPAPRTAILRTRGDREPALSLDIEYPAEGAVFGGVTGAFVSGRAVALPGDVPQFDVMLVLDTSASTIAASGADINGNGVVGRDRMGGMFGGSDAGDSILAAEVAAALRLLDDLDPRFARVGLVTFAGKPPDLQPGTFSIGGMGARPPAITEVPLTTDYARVRQSLVRVLQRGPGGDTHMAAGVDQGTKELLGVLDALSEPNPASEKIVFFLTDGEPTLPYHRTLYGENVNAALRAAQRSQKAHVTVHTFAIGPEALQGPIAAVEIAELTGGVFTPVRHPADIVPAIETVNLARIEELTIRNETTGDDVTEIVTSSDGRWSALVPLQTGRNRISVVATSSDGLVERREVEVAHAPDAELPPLPAAHVADRNELLQRRLLALQREGEVVEAVAAEKTRRELMVEIEAEREAARARADAQRKELQLEVLAPPAGEPATP